MFLGSFNKAITTFILIISVRVLGQEHKFGLSMGVKPVLRVPYFGQYAVNYMSINVNGNRLQDIGGVSTALFSASLSRNTFQAFVIALCLCALT